MVRGGGVDKMKQMEGDMERDKNEMEKGRKGCETENEQREG
jgi:hypothetical protein